jgi:histidyl-tRNA synthetase
MGSRSTTVPRSNRSSSIPRRAAKRSSGQLYNFTDKGGREVALRPEMTPTLARIVGARAGGLRKPIRWFSVPQLFRYERTQRGRLREHFQWNVDILGESGIDADAEVLATALDALLGLGLRASDIVARYSDRRLLERLFLNAGVPEDRLLRAYGAVDKLTREPRDRVLARLVGAGIDEAVAERVLKIFDASTGLEGIASAYGSVEAIGEEIERLHAYRASLEDLGLGECIAFDPAIVRGLAYYTGTVFEIFDRKGELRAICGGGRYDDLLRALAGVDLPAVGFGMGDVVIGELLAERNLIPPYAQDLGYYVVAVSEAERPLARRVAAALRRRGQSASYGLKPAGVGRQFKDADAAGARRAVVLGPEEVAAGEAVVREMRSGEEARVSLASLLEVDAERSQ